MYDSSVKDLFRDVTYLKSLFWSHFYVYYLLILYVFHVKASFINYKLRCPLSEKFPWELIFKTEKK